MAAYYNEIDPHCAAWLRNLIAAGEIAPGEVDERDIRDVAPDDLVGFSQAHFFAGIGLWSLALRRAGWPDERPVWTGSCPCQPFSSAGRKAGLADERHLWPHWFHLLEIWRPEVVFGEQVASKDGLAWVDLVQADLEGAGYAARAFDLCAAGFGAPHIRQRLYFAAVSDDACVGQADASRQRRDRLENPARQGRRSRAEAGCAPGVALGDADHARPQGHGGHGDRSRKPGRVDADAAGSARPSGADGGLADDLLPERPGGERESRPDDAEPGRDEGATAASGHGGDCGPGPVNGFWRAADWLGCRDGKWRPVEPGTFPLVDGGAFQLGSGGAFEGKSRAKLLSAAGNGIVVEQAVEFIAATKEYVDQ